MARLRRKNYDMSVLVPQVERLAKMGLTMEEICEALIMTPHTFYMLRDQYPEFDKAFKEGKSACNERVVAKLYTMAINGVKTTKRKTIRNITTGEIIETNEETHIESPQTCLKWLHNCMPEQWRPSSRKPVDDESEEPVDEKNLCITFNVVKPNNES